MSNTTMNSGIRSRLANTMIAAAVLVLVSTFLVWSDDWSRFGRDDARTNASPEVTGTDFSAGSWFYDMRGIEILSTPAVADGYVVIGSHDWFVRCFAEDTGEVVWSFQADGFIGSSPAIDTGRVYFASQDGNLYCRALEDGSEIWTLPTEGTEWSSPVVVNGRVLLGSGFPNSDTLVVDASTGAVLFSPDTDNMVYGSATVSGNTYYVAAVGGTIYSFDMTTGAENWFLSLGGTVDLTSLLLEGDSLYIAPGGTSADFHRVDTNSADWGADNWNLTVTDPNAPAAAFQQEESIATSSCVSAGGRIVLMVRFDYYRDTNFDFLSDEYIFNEYLVGVDPTGQTVDWQEFLGTRTEDNYNNIPGELTCPTPAVILTSSGDRLAVRSTVADNLMTYHPTTGAKVDEVDAGGPGRSSPVFANGRVVFGVDHVGVISLLSTENAPPAVVDTGLDPVEGEDVSTTTPNITWQDTTDADAGDTAGTLTYTVRIDDDGEILMDWDEEQTLAAGVTSFTPGSALSNNETYTYAVRARDDSGSWAPWSEKISFSVSKYPDGPSGLTAVPGNEEVRLSWTVSADASVVAQELRWEDSNGSAIGNTVLGVTTSETIVSVLQNFETYTFYLRVVDGDGDASSEISVSSTPLPPVTLNGVTYPSIQAAIDAAVPGQTVQLSSDEFEMSATLVVPEGISLAGTSPRDTILTGDGTFNLVEVTSGVGGVTAVANLDLNNGLNGVVLDNAQDILLQNLVIRDSAEHGVQLVNGSSGDLRNLTLLGNQDGVRVEDTSVLVIRNTVAIRNRVGLRAPIATQVVSTYNCVHNNADFDLILVDAGLGDISENVVFVDEVNRDLRVTLAQPTIDAGDGSDPYRLEPKPNGFRINIGAFGNTSYAAKSASTGGGGSSGGACLVSSSGHSPYLLLIALLSLVFVIRRR